jgi:WD40 repeat protein/KaiC/GvpD/RAD55 family RecA-like ATPase
MSNLDASILRALKGESAIGAGFLAAEGLAVTCAHVLRAAGADFEGATVQFDFPLIAPGETVSGGVLFLDTDKDIAVLEVTQKLPKGVESVRMVTAGDMWDHKFRAFGFPTGYDSGVWASGVLRGRTADGWLHIEDTKETGFRVQPGFSGGPIWDEELQAIIGMVVAAEQDASIKAAFCIPTSSMIAAYPGLKERAIPACPYRGLYAFREQDAASFFGRETFTASLFESVQSRALVAVVGASGNGKSSVVFAGLLPKLRKDTRWLIVDFRPGPQPFESLAAGLLPLLEPSMTEIDRLVETRKLASALQNGDVHLIHVVKRLLEKHNPADKLLLVADQFEELYTYCKDAELRRRFLDVLLEALNSQRRILVTSLITLRADFMEQALAHRLFADALQDANLILGPMAPEELIQAIEKPAQLQDVEFERGLPALIVDQIENQPAALPLLEFALTQLWDRQENGHLTLKAYQDIGGVEKALALYADQAYNDLRNEQREKARRIFIQLVHPGLGTEDTRRLAVRSDLEEEDWELVRQLANLRLVVTDRTPDGQETAEVVHEALIREWGQLRLWMQTDRVFRAWQERLRVAMRQWQDTGKDEGALLRGRPLAEAEGWLEERASDISALEEVYINTSIELREFERVEEEERRRRELEAAQKLAEVESRSAQRARRFTRLLVGITLVALGALVFSLFAYNQSEAQRVAALARLALRKDTLDRNYPHLAAILGLQSLQIAKTSQALDLVSEIPINLVGYSFYKGFPADPEAVYYKRFPGVPEAVYKISWLSDRQVGIASLYEPSSDVTLTLWDLESGKPKQVLKAKADDLWSPAWSPDGRLASGTKDGTVILWDLKTGEPAQTLEGHKKVVHSLAWSSDGRLASGSEDGTVIVWDLKTGKPTQTLEGHKKVVHSLAWSLDGQLASGSEDGTVIVWDLENEEPAKILKGHEEFVNSVAWSSNGLLASGSGDGTVIVWDLETEEPAHTLKGHSDQVRSVAWSPDGQLASGSDDRIVILWDLEAEEPAKILKGHSDQVRSVAWSPNGRLASGSEDDTFILWDLESGEPARKLEGHLEDVKSVAWSLDGRLASGSDDGTVIVWDLKSGKSPQRLEEHEEPVTSVAWSQDGRLASGSEDGTVIVWDLKSGKSPQMLEGHEEAVNSVAWSADGQLASGAEDGTVIIWNLQSGEPAQKLKEHEEAVNSVAWSADGQLASGSIDGTVVVWDLGKSVKTLPIPGRRIWSVAWSPDGQLASGLGDGTVILWDLESRKPAQTLEGHLVKEGGNKVLGMAWSSDGRLASGANDGTVILWNLKTEEPAQRFRIEGASSVDSVAWSPDGQLAFGSDNKNVYVIHEKLTHPPCEWVGRNLTFAEWKKNLGFLHVYRPACPNLPAQSIIPFSREYFESTSLGRILALLALLIFLAILIMITRLVFRISKQRRLQLRE